MFRSLANKIYTAKEAVEKKQRALREDFPLHAYLTQQSIKVMEYPFPCIVVDNFFNEETYRNICTHFESVLEGGFSKIQTASQFHPFEYSDKNYEYDGYVYAPWPKEADVLQLFFSLAWNTFFANIFGQATSLCTSMAYHHHPAGNRTGFIHNDFTPKIFSLEDKLENGVIFREYHGAAKSLPYTPTLIRETRKIALIYYIGNRPWQEGDGGETGLYESKEGKPKVLIAPQSNRLLAFLISSNSFHAFQENFQSRDSIVQWFHSND